MLEVRGQFAIPLDELREAYTSTLRDLFGGPAELANRHGDPEKAAHPEAEAARPRSAERAGQPVVEPAAPTGMCRRTRLRCARLRWN